MARCVLARRYLGAFCAPTVLWIALLLASVVALAALDLSSGRRPRTYNLTYAIQGSSAGFPSWGAYDFSVSDADNRSSVTYVDDSTILQPLGFCMPFFQSNRAQIYVSSNGFLSPMPFGMCKHFCGGAEAEVEGYYKADTYITGGGGDWPMLALYVQDLDPTSLVTRDLGGAIFIAEKQKEGQRVMLVEFRRVAQYIPATPNPPRTTVTAQAELWPNGTIIFRYTQVLSVFSTTLDSLLPTVGLVWSKAQRRLATTPRYRSSPTNVSINAIRFEPEDDPCRVNTTCQTCVQGNGCTWCSNKNWCVRSDLARDVCQSADARGHVLNCERFAVSDYNDTSGSQFFYNTHVPDQTFEWHDLRDIAGSTSVFNSSTPATYPRRTNPLEIRFPFNWTFPFFYNPINPNPEDPQNLPSMWLFPTGLLSQTNEQSCTVNNQGFCGAPSSGYNFALAAFAAGLKAQATTSSAETLPLPARSPGSLFCEASLFSTTCPSAVVIQMTNFIAVNDLGQRFTTQVVLSQDGTVQLRYNSSFNHSQFPPSAFPGSGTGDCPVTSPFTAFPRGYSGLFRRGVNDPASSIIPWGILEAGSVVIATPIPGCADCGSHGKCNMATRQCVCDPTFTGEMCDQCKPNFFESSCLACPKCLNGGVCDDGRNGTGNCKCAGPFGGQLCEKTCPAGVDPTCPGCSLKGGYCDCGKCTCYANKGWTGPNCSSWRDPCSQFSLDGCTVCLTQEVAVCRYCSSHRCISAPGQVGFFDPNISTCSDPLGLDIGNTIAECPVYRGDQVTPSSIALFIVIVAFIIMGVGACVGVVVFCGCKKRPPSILETNALPGTADFDPPRREREVIQVQILPPQKQRPVLGLPLKQIPLKELAALQKGKIGLAASAVSMNIGSDDGAMEFQP